MTSQEIIKVLKKYRNEKNIAGMARFGISGGEMLGINIPVLRKMAKDIVKKAGDNRHEIAQDLWKSGIHEAKILASMVDDFEKLTEKQMDNWIKDFDSWDVCDQVSMNLFEKSPIAYKKAIEWSKRKPEFEKRAGFALMAVLAWHDKKAEDKKVLQFLPIIKRESIDERNYVRKSVNWALRQIGKRNPSCKKQSISTAKEILKIDNKTASWIARDALRELEKINIMES